MTSPSAATQRVLIVEDDEETRLALTDALRELGHDVVAEESAEGAIETARREDFGAVLSDIRMAGMDGVELCSRLATDGPNVPVVVMTAFGDVASARAALRAGAFDFLTKPFTLQQVATALERALAFSSRQSHVKRLPSRTLPAGVLGDLIGSSPAMRAVHEAIALAGPTESSVLITGESGTGKELVARAIHRASYRASGPFVAVSCAALPGSVLEAEFFGHVRGAFTGATEARHGLLAQADGGTLFLDEIGDMPLELQPKLLRALQQRSVRPLGAHHEASVDVRIVAATNRDLEFSVLSGVFREDLYYRLNILGIHLPPLRERGDDIRVLARHFVERASSEQRPLRLSAEAEAALLQHRWPGNVRELENCIQAATALVRGDVVGVEELRLQLEPSRPMASRANGSTLEEVERRHIMAVLTTLDWNKALAARKLGINRATLYRKMKRYGLNHKR